MQMQLPFKAIVRDPYYEFRLAENKAMQKKHI